MLIKRLKNIKIHKSLLDRAGTTLVELLVASSLMTVVLASTYAAFGTTVSSFNLTAQNTRTYEIARRANNELTDKIKRAELPLIQASRETIIFNLDILDGTDTPGSEMIVYTYIENDPVTGDPLHIVEKTIYDYQGALVSKVTIATNVINKLVFDFYDGDHQVINMPADSGDPQYSTLIKQIKMVRITSRVQVEDVAGYPKNVNLESEVNLRHAP